ncbi:MAG: zinc-dependent metalloprotease [Vicingus serpentipes]|nr:zinc-dependent metalloprotease [Vicingus serpentipes]
MLKKPFLFTSLLLFSFLINQPNTNAQKKKKTKSEASTSSQDKNAPKKIEELIKSSKKIDGLFPVYQDTITGDIKIVVARDQIEKEFIYFSQIANGISDIRSFVKGTYRGSKVFKIKKYFNKIEFVTQSSSFYFDPKNNISKAADANISEGVMASLKIEGIDKEKGLYLIDANNLFLKETFSQIKPARHPKESATAFSLGKLDQDKTKINGIRNYPQNTDLAIEYVYSNESILNGGSDAVADGRNVSIKVYHSLIKMPENDYTPLIDDPRVGYFTTQVTDMTSTGSVPYRDLVHRWNLKKKNPEATISEPIEPIVWWMEKTTPEEWRETIKQAVLQWNKAFENAGFKNAMVVKLQPDTASWDAGDIRYNVLRWTSSPKAPFGGYGPSFANPRTGQILGADIMLEFLHFTNRVMYDKIFDLGASHYAADHDGQDYMDEKFCSLGSVMHENTMFGNVVLEASGSSDLNMERMKKEAMTALIMHEIGHTLGLNHNMKASQLFSPEQLADADFIKGKALTGSVMDYAAINLTKDPKKQEQFYDVAVGPYDVWAIEFGYTPFSSEEQKQALLNKSTQPELIFGNDADDMRSPGKAIDPRVMIGDLSNDQITYSSNIFDLINTMMPNVKTKFSKEGGSYQELRRVYYILSKQRAQAANVVSRFIGGVYVDRAMVGQKGETKPYTPVNLADQKRAMSTLSKYVFDANAFDAPNDLYNYLAMQRRGYNFSRGPEDPKIHQQVLSYQKNVLEHLLHPNTLQRIVDSELYGNDYSLSTMMTDLNDAIFKADIFTGNVNSFRQNLQAEYTKMLIAIAIGPNSDKYITNAVSMAVYNLKQIRKATTNASGDTSTKAHKTYLATLIDNALKEIK